VGETCCEFLLEAFPQRISRDNLRRSAQFSDDGLVYAPPRAVVFCRPERTNRSRSTVFPVMAAGTHGPQGLVGRPCHSNADGVT